MKTNTPVERLYNGIVKENPTFVLLLGMCPTLAVTTCAINGLGMGLTTAAVLALSNLFISLLRNIIPDRVRIPAFIVIIASFVTVVELLLEAYIPSLYDALGLYIPLIVVNCIILGRAEAYASKNKAVASFFDGVGMGLGFTLALTIIGAVRELIGAGELFGKAVMPSSYVPCSIFIMAPGAFFVLAVLTAIQNVVKKKGAEKGKDVSKIQSGCGHDCLNCKDSGCADRVIMPETDIKKDAKAEVKPEGKKEIKTETKSKVKTEVKAETKSERKTEVKAETKSERKAETKSEEKALEKSEEKEETKVETKTETKTETKAETMPEAEFFDLDAAVEDTVQITADDIAAINAAVEKLEKEETK